MIAQPWLAIPTANPAKNAEMTPFFPVQRFFTCILYRN